MAPIEVVGWQLEEVGRPLVRAGRTVDPARLGPGEALVEVAGCGVCHTDLGYAFEGVRTRHPLPLVLGHEISGIVVAAGQDAGVAPGQAVIVPAVIPCGRCEACRAGRGAICPDQVFPGNDVHGGFATHVVVPARGLCPVDTARLAAAGLDLADLAVVADAITTPYQAIVHAGLGEGDVAVFVGVGGVGSFGVQLAAALGAHVVALDVDPERVERAAAHGAELAWVIDDPRAVRKRLRREAAERGWPRVRWRIFETSGHVAGQELAFSLLPPGGWLGVVGFTLERARVRLSNLMALDAEARGTWGCLPERYPEALGFVLDGRLELRPFIERRPLAAVNDTFEELRGGRLKVRPILVPGEGA